jgi:hypothetical protein
VDVVAAIGAYEKSAAVVEPSDGALDDPAVAAEPRAVLMPSIEYWRPVMFTDIANSTLLTNQLGESRWRALLEAHNSLVPAQPAALARGCTAGLQARFGMIPGRESPRASHSAESATARPSGRRSAAALVKQR